jgi:hypothetical protein
MTHFFVGDEFTQALLDALRQYAISDPGFQMLFSHGKPRDLTCARTSLETQKWNSGCVNRRGSLVNFGLRPVSNTQNAKDSTATGAGPHNPVRREPCPPWDTRVRQHAPSRRHGSTYRCIRRIRHSGGTGSRTLGRRSGAHDAGGRDYQRFSH